MDFERLKKRTLLTAAVAAVAYSAATGKGLFNKPRFREQHEALGKYVDTNYPGCTYTPITVHGRGWSSCVKRMGRPVSNIYFTKSPEGVYIFTENAIN